VYSDVSHGCVLVALAVPLVALLVAAVKSSEVWSRHLAGRPWWLKAAAVGGLVVAVLIGGDKPGPQPPAEVVELLTMRADGSLRDSSGEVGSGVQAQALEDYVAESSNVVHAADSVIEQAEIDTIALTNQLLTADYDIAYLSLDLPRGTTTGTNHNIMISFQRVEQHTNTLDALVWFSEMPETNINVFVEYSLAENVWGTLPAITNYYPDTEMVDGVECIRYSYQIPSGVVGTPLKPNYEISFGGYEPDQYLSVPETGVVVSTNGVDCLPYTGWDDYSEGDESVLVRYVGGIAVEAITNGVTLTGVN
jgi:hypothetical protein